MNNIILRNRVTEKSAAMAGQTSLLAESSARAAVYTFEVQSSATKSVVAREVKNLYKVNPASVRMVRLPRKKIATRQGVGHKKAVKKALVTLKKGEKIETL